MNHIHRILAAIAVLLLAVICGCSNDAGSGNGQDSDDRTMTLADHGHDGGAHEHDGEAGEHGREGRSEHDRDADGHDGEEGEESGTEFALNETYDEVRHGARLILAYDANNNSFQGTVENTTEETLERVRVEVHLSNGKELGPTTPADLEPGEKREVKLTATSTEFDGWSAHPEVGNREHGHGEGGGEHGEDGDEHGGEGQSEHDRDGSEHGEEGNGEHDREGNEHGDEAEHDGDGGEHGEGGDDEHE